MNERKLELVVTRENGKIKKVRIRKGSDYIYEMKQYLNKFGNIEFKNLEDNTTIETSIESLAHPKIDGLVKPSEELLYDIRANFLKITGMFGNYYNLHTRDKELVLDRSSDKYIVGTIKFFNKKEEHSAQEYLNNISDTLRNDCDLILSLNKVDVNANFLHLCDNNKVLDICSINEVEIMAMLSDEDGIPIVNHTDIKELIYLIYSKRRLSSVGEKSRCMLGTYILNLKNKESDNEIE